MLKNNVLEHLKENKIKITNERVEIISVLEKTTFPLTPADLLIRIQAKLPKANLTTVYRNLEMLEDFGLVKRLTFNKTSFSYEIVSNRAHHHHVICKSCGKVEDLENISEKFVSGVSEHTNFEIQDHNLEFFGLCPDCREKQSVLIK